MLTESHSQTAPVPEDTPGGLWSGEVVRWRRWWCELRWSRRYGPALGVAVFWMGHAMLGGLRGDHFLLGIAVAAVAYAGPRLAEWFRLLLPAALMGAVYDGQGYVRAALAGKLTIHVSEPAAIDRLLFGITTASGVVTPSAWWQIHTHPFLDVACGFVYITFVPAFLGAAIWFRWRAERQAPGERARQRREAEGMTWAFFWLGLISCATYYVYPAAPPWYADRFGTIVMDVAPSAAGAARVDALLGIRLFAEFYGRAPNIFGAIPSLHVAIPLLAFAFAWRIGALRWPTGVYTLLMAFSAIYLNHHYVIDVLWGAAYVGLVVGVFAWRARRTPAEGAA